MKFLVPAAVVFASLFLFGCCACDYFIPGPPTIITPTPGPYATATPRWTPTPIRTATPVASPTASPGSCPQSITGCCTINSPGNYTLSADIGPFSGTCITIAQGGSGTTLDCRGHTMTGGTLASNGIVVYSEGVTVKNCVITDCLVGLTVYYSNGGTYLNNTCSNGVGDSRGFQIEYSTGNTFTGNTANNNANGFYFEHSGNNRMTGNTANENGNTGFFITSCSGNRFTNNTATGNAGQSYSPPDFKCDMATTINGGGNVCGHQDCGLGCGAPLS